MKVVILPGLDGTGGMVVPFVDAVGLDCAVLSYPDQLHSYDQIIDWIQPQLPESPFVIVAESFSGPVAVRIAHTNYTNLRGVVLVATFARSPRYLPALMFPLLSMLPINSRFFGFLSQPLVMGRWTSRQFRKQFCDLLGSVPKATLIARLKQVSLVDVADLVAEVDVPMIYLQAKDDRLVPARAARDFRRIKVISGPHFLLQANPMASAEAVIEFIDEHGTP